MREEFGRVDVLFNNAGISPTDDASVLDTTLEAWQRVQDVNLKSVFLCCKHGIPHLIDGGGGSVINTASFVATMGSATSQISYTASKGGVLALSRELGVEFARRGVRVNALCPGPVNTPLLQELFAKDPVAAARRLVHVPTGRFAEVREIANAVLFLASRRVVVRERDELHGRRRDLAGVHHAGVAAPDISCALARQRKRPHRRRAARCRARRLADRGPPAAARPRPVPRARACSSGPTGSAGSTSTTSQLAESVGVIALALILFEGGLAAGWGEIRPVLRPALEPRAGRAR